MMGVTRDITQRKLAQLALERSREQFELAVRGMNDGIWDWDIRTNSLYLSPLWKQMVGYQEDELPNEMATFESRIHPEDYNRVMSYLQTYLAGELSEYRIEFRFRHRKGHYVWILARGEALRDRSGRPYRMAGSHSDITESKEMLQKLEHSERRFREIAETLPEMLYEALLDGRLIYVNPRAFELTGYCPEDIEAGLNVIDLVVPRDRGKARHTMQRVLSGERSGLRQYSLIRKDGSELPVLIHSIPVLREDQVIGLRGFLVDISERVVMENQMRQMEKMNAIGQLAGGIAHDFNNQIAGVMGYCQMLRKRLEDPVQQTLLDKILSSALRSADLTRKLLAFSHQGQQEITRVDLNALIHEVVDVLKHCIDRRIEFTLLLASEPLYVEGDYTQLQNALLNLGLNARDAMPSGGEIRVESAQVVLDQEASRRIDLALDPGEYVRVVVADTGCGMSESVKERIFEPFFTTKKVGEGSGMGLPAVYGTVKHHRGAISVSSKEGEGAVFTLWFPAGCHEISNSGISQTHEASDAFCDRLLGKKLLLIDDEQIVCEIAQEAFESVGAEVEVFEDAVLAVEYFRNHHLSVDLVMLDLNMPRLDGEQVLAYLTEINPGVPILIVSGTRLTGKLLAMHEQGELGYLSKPFELDRLIHTASAVLQGHAEGQDDQG
jgi:PAS domain S-box-containing protein